MSDTVSICKKLIRAIGLKSKDFNLKRTSTQRYPGNCVYNWYEVQCRDVTVDGGDPNCGKMITEIKYHFIFCSIFEIAPGLVKLAEKKGFGDSSWSFAKSISDGDFEEIKQVWDREYAAAKTGGAS